MRLALDRAGVRFGNHRVLDDVTLAIEPGTVVDVRGANGAGKSTLLRVLVGVQRPTSGRRSAPAAAAYVPAAFVPPTLAVRAWITGFRPHDTDPLAVLERLAFAGELDAPLAELSFGNLRKVALAEAFASSAPVVVIDEASSGLDDPGAHAVAALVDEAANAGRIVVFADQDGQRAARSTRSLRVADGAVAERPAGLARVAFEADTATIDSLVHLARELGVRPIGDGAR